MTKNKLKLLLLSLTLLTTQACYADWQDSLNEAWKSTKEVSDSAFESSKEYTNNALDKSKNYYDEMRLDSISSDNVTPQMIQQQKKEHIQTIWKDILTSLDGALSLNAQIDDAPASRFFGADKKSLGEDQVDVFEVIEALLSSPEINKNRDNIEALKGKVGDKKNTISRYLEKRIVADNTDRAEYDQKIKKAKADISELTRRIDNEKNILKQRFNASGLFLNDGQVDVLLSRVDADDIIKMSLVYDVLEDITSQLMGLTKESNENIDQARKYYGMHVVLLKLVINMQDSYVKKLNEEYLPKIEVISMETRRISEKTTYLLKSETQRNRKDLLHKNLKAQQLTLKVAKLYAQQLNQQKAKVIKAQKLMVDDYQVAKNTYDTVKISADLIQLMKTNQASFSALMNIQIPDIVPFENLDMQRKFEELSAMIK
ncbi:MAG: hypothetical protein KAH03_04555 [Cocleimonas sp.]|nr:hypothetical protein [Cocleimonas sp.]